MNKPGKFGSATQQVPAVCYATGQSEGSETAHRHAFTIVEITVAMCILSILSAIAMPRAAKLLDRIRVQGAVMDIASLFSSARHIAIAHSTQATVEIDAAAQTLYVIVGTDTLRKRDIGKEHGVQLTATRVRMSYSATGSGYGAANLSVVVRRSSAVDTVFVSRLGRVRH
jgi:prepilin-type N-terminal cleavage/methylation domain-containing protein